MHHWHARGAGKNKCERNSGTFMQRVLCASSRIRCPCHPESTQSNDIREVCFEELDAQRCDFLRKQGMVFLVLLPETLIIGFSLTKHKCVKGNRTELHANNWVWKPGTSATHIHKDFNTRYFGVI